jgi:hypothetical protein
MSFAKKNAEKGQFATKNDLYFACNLSTDIGAKILLPALLSKSV